MSTLQESSYSDKQYSNKLQEGIRFFQKADYDSAQRVLEEAIDIRPNASRCLYWLGQTKHQLFELDEAIDCFKKAIELNQEQPMYYLGLAQLYIEDNQESSAQDVLHAALEKSPNNGQLHSLQGVIYNEKEDYDRAIQSFETSLKFMPELTDARIQLATIRFNQGQYDKAIGLLNEGDQKSYKILTLLGTMYYNMGQHVNALIKLEASLTENDKQADVFDLMGSMFMHEKNYPRAEKMFEKAIAIDETLARSYNNLGIINMQRHDDEQAGAYFAKAISIDNYHAEYHNNLGVVYWSMNNLPDAESAFIKAIEMDSAYEQAYINLISLYQSVDKADRCLALFEAYAKNHTPSSQFYLETIKSLIKCKSFDTALQLADAALEGCEQPAVFINLKMQIFWLDGQLDACEREARALVDLEPDYVDAHMALSTLSLLKRNWQTGFQEYNWRLPEDIRQGDSNDVVPLWQGEPLAEKTLLVWSEPSLDETLVFMSLFKSLQAQGCHLVFLCDPGMSNLVEQSFENVTLKNIGDPLAHENADFHCPVGNLAQYLRQSDADFNSVPESYLVTEFSIKNANRLVYRKDIDLPIIGLHTCPDSAENQSWIRQINNEIKQVIANYVLYSKAFTCHESLRTISLDSLASLNIDQIATKIAALDVLFTDDSGIALLAGALGTRCHYIAPENPDWWWLAAGHTTPWFPCISIIRDETDIKQINLKKYLKKS